MATIMDWDLQPREDGKLALIFWDSMHGEDIVLEISPGGAIHQVRSNLDPDDENWIEETRTPIVNLHAALSHFLTAYLAERGGSDGS